MHIAASKHSVTLTHLLVSQMEERKTYTKLLEVQAIANMKSIRKQTELLRKLKGRSRNANELIASRKWHQKMLEEFKANAVEFSQQLQRHELECNAIMRCLKETDMAIAQLKNLTHAS